MSDPFDLKTNDWLDDADKKRKYNKELFAVVAPKYDFVTKALSLGRDQAWKRRLIASLPVPDGSSPACLDLACGTGDVTFAIANKYGDGNVIGLDLCEAMITLATKRQKEEHAALVNVRFQVGDMSKTKLPERSIGIITGSYALRNAPSLASALDEVSRVLIPGGTAAFLDFSKPQSKVVQHAEHFVLNAWGSFWGLVLHRNPAVYAYIAKSLQEFPDRNTLHEMIRSRGFVNLRTERFYFGALELLVFDAPQ